MQQTPEVGRYTALMSLIRILKDLKIIPIGRHELVMMKADGVIMRLVYKQSKGKFKTNNLV